MSTTSSVPAKRSLLNGCEASSSGSKQSRVTDSAPSIPGGKTAKKNDTSLLHENDDDYENAIGTAIEERFKSSSLTSSSSPLARSQASVSSLPSGVQSASGFHEHVLHKRREVLERRLYDAERQLHDALQKIKELKAERLAERKERLFQESNARAANGHAALRDIELANLRGALQNQKRGKRKAMPNALGRMITSPEMAAQQEVEQRILNKATRCFNGPIKTT